jgi:ABC-type cobalamin/Fe3+-siderophores transport system ATPase subunit
LLNDGALFCEGSPEAVLSQHNIARVYGIDSQITRVGKELSVSPIARLSNY